MHPDPRVERGDLLQTEGPWISGPHAALKSLLVKAGRNPREANSQWKSECLFKSSWWSEPTLILPTLGSVAILVLIMTSDNHFLLIPIH